MTTSTEPFTENQLAEAAHEAIAVNWPPCADCFVKAFKISQAHAEELMNALKSAGVIGDDGAVAIYPADAAERAARDWHRAN